MALISLDEAKSYLRVDTEDEDAMIAILLSSAGRLCADVARLTDEQWAAVNDDNADAALAPVRETITGKGKPCYFGAVYEHLDDDLSCEGIIGLRTASEVAFEDDGHAMAWAMAHTED